MRTDLLATGVGPDKSGAARDGENTAVDSVGRHAFKPKALRVGVLYQVEVLGDNALP